MSRQHVVHLMSWCDVHARDFTDQIIINVDVEVYFNKPEREKCINHLTGGNFL